MKRSTLISLILALSFLGALDAAYLAETALTQTALTCNIAGLDGCNTVAQSAYSHLFGIPLGVYGLGFYAVIGALAIAAALRPRRWLDRTLFAAALLGAFASVGFLYIQFALIKAICVYCLASAAISFALPPLAGRLAVPHEPEPSSSAA